VPIIAPFVSVLANVLRFFDRHQHLRNYSDNIISVRVLLRVRAGGAWFTLGIPPEMTLWTLHFSFHLFDSDVIVVVVITIIIIIMIIIIVINFILLKI